ncbi:hypothetical protein L2E82_25960 [Cichorium intybus]|uniref:Uncharacterized protein n=1 Tax=Cichorium intybus TaxID=13427 RepID=A0ACB9E5C7_CICIN|nr:hypothetical protein L2E82_25960 [Cichorium intybus]
MGRSLKISQTETSAKAGRTYGSGPLKTSQIETSAKESILLSCCILKGKEILVRKADVPVKKGVEEGLLDVTVEQTLVGHGNAADLLESGYSTDEVLRVLQDLPLEVAITTPIEEEDS